MVALAALLYFLMPFDAVPDFILSLGMIDDFAILAWVAKHFQQELAHYQSWREREEPSSDTKSDDPNLGAPDRALAEVSPLKVGPIRRPPLPWDASRPLLAAVPYV